MKKTKIIASIVALSCTMGVLSAKPKADSSSGKSYKTELSKKVINVSLGLTYHFPNL